MCRHPPAAACSASCEPGTGTGTGTLHPWTPWAASSTACRSAGYALAVSASCRAIIISASLAEGSEYPKDSKISWSGTGVASDSKRGLKNGSDQMAAAGRGHSTCNAHKVPLHVVCVAAEQGSRLGSLRPRLATADAWLCSVRRGTTRAGRLPMRLRQEPDPPRRGRCRA